MSAWLWVTVGIGAFLFLSIVVSLTLAAVLGAISRRLEAELREDELWAISSLTREEADAEHEAGAAEQPTPTKLSA
jgi:hypothetical protein